MKCAKATFLRQAQVGFFTGVFSTQIVNSALHLAQPLLVAEITGSIGLAAFFSAFDTAVHMLGTYLSGWPVNAFGARRVLVSSTFLRGLCLSAIPLGMLGHVPITAPWVMTWYSLDALVRGFTDAAAYTLPLEVAEHHGLELDKLNSRFEIVFDGGGILGPLALGGLLLWFPGALAHALIAGGFVCSALAFASIPKPSPRALRHLQPKFRWKGGTWSGLRLIWRDPRLLLACVGYMSFNIYPLRKLLGAFFAKSILHSPPLVGTLGAAFGAGGLAGALLYAQNRNAPLDRAWITAGAVGLLLLAIGWVPGSLWIMAAGAFVFAFTNVGARLTLTRIRQEHTPLENAGGVTAASRFGANLVSVSLKAAVGAAFALGASAYQAFALVGLGLGLLAASQLVLAQNRLFRRGSSAF